MATALFGLKWMKLISASYLRVNYFMHQLMNLWLDGCEAYTIIENLMFRYNCFIVFKIGGPVDALATGHWLLFVSSTFASSSASVVPTWSKAGFSPSHQNPKSASKLLFVGSCGVVALLCTQPYVCALRTGILQKLKANKLRHIYLLPHRHSFFSHRSHAKLRDGERPWATKPWKRPCMEVHIISFDDVSLMVMMFLITTKYIRVEWEWFFLSGVRKRQQMQSQLLVSSLHYLSTDQ